MRLTTLFTSLFCLLASGLLAQLANTNAYIQLWEIQKRSRNNNNAGTIAMDIQTDAQGNIYTLTNFAFDLGQGISVRIPSLTKHTPTGTLLWEYQFGRAELLDTTVQYFDFFNEGRLALDVRSNGNLETVSVISEVFTERTFNVMGTRLLYGMLTHFNPQTGARLQAPTYFTDNALGLMGSYFKPVSVRYGGDGVAWVAIERQTGTGTREDYFYSHNRITNTTQTYNLSPLLQPNAVFGTPLVASLGNGYAIGSMFYNAGGGASSLVVSLNSQNGNILLDSILGWDPRDLQRNPTTGRADLLLAGLHLIELDSTLSKMAILRAHGIDTLAVIDHLTSSRLALGASRLAYAEGNPDPFIFGLNTSSNILFLYGTGRSNRGGVGALTTFRDLLIDYSAVTQGTISNFAVRYAYGRAELVHVFRQQTLPFQQPFLSQYHQAIDIQNVNPQVSPAVFFTALQDELFYSNKISVTSSNDRQSFLTPFAISPYGMVSARGHLGFHADSSSQNTANSYLFVEYANNVAGILPADPCHQGVTFGWSLPSSICDTAETITLSATPAGGVFTGTNVVGGVFFDPQGLAAGSYTLTYTVTTRPGCDTSFSRSINVVACSQGDTIPIDTTDPGSRAQLLRAQTSLYPNPAQGSVTLALPAGTVAQDVVLLTAQGHVVRRMDARLMGSELRIDLGDLPAGLYFVRAITPQGTFSLPLQKL